MTETETSRRPKDALSRKPFATIPRWIAWFSALPLSFWYGVSSTLAWLAEHVVRYRRQVIDAQVRKCFPAYDDAEVDRVRRGFYRNFLDVLAESVKALTISGEELDRRVELAGFDFVRGHILAGQTVVLATGHVCNWEWTLQAISRHLGHPVDAAYKPLHNELSDRLFLTLRSRFGAKMVPDRRLLMHVLRRRKQPRAVAMVADQDPILSAVRHTTRFFGHETTFFMGPEAIARAVKGPIVFVAVERLSRGHYRVTLEPLVGPAEELPEGAMVDRFAARLEAQIRAHPSDWLWAYRRWKVRRRKPGAESVVRDGG